MSPENHFIDRMLSIFHAPITENESGFVDEMRKAIKGWDLSTLNEAADRIAKTAKFFPKPAEVIEVCEIIANERAPKGSTPPVNLFFTGEAFRTANRLIRSEMGREAARDGWIGQLHDFCRQKGRLPKGFEISHLKSEAKLFDASYSEVCAGKGGTLGTALRKLGETFLEKRNDLAAIANGEDRNLTDRSRAMSGETD